MSRVVTIEGSKILTKTQFHRAIADALGFPDYYGRNLDALWDVMTNDIERPVTLVWKDCQTSRDAMVVECDRILEVLRDVEKRDVEVGLPPEQRFHFICQ